MPKLHRSQNRNGALFIGFLVVATLVVIVALNKANVPVNSNVAGNVNVPDGIGGGQIDLQNDSNTNATQDPADTETYTNSDLGVTVHAVKQAVETVSGDITTIDFGHQDSLSILSPDLEGIVRESIGNIQESNITIGGVQGVSVTGSSAKDGSSRTLVLVTVNNRLYVFDGSLSFLAGLPSDVEFVK